MLHELGAVQNPSEAALSAYVKRIDKVDDLEWMRDPEKVIETLKKWAQRYLPDAIHQLKAEVFKKRDDGALSPEQLETAARAFERYWDGGGFDIQHEVWNNLRAAVGRPFPE